MASIEYRLSKKVGNDGKSQVKVILTISRTNRPYFNSGVFVKPDYFKVVKVTEKGNVYGIVPPKRGKLNVHEVDEAFRAKDELDDFSNRLTNLCNKLSLEHGDLLTRNFIEEALTLTMNFRACDVSYESIMDIRAKRKEERMQKALRKDPEDIYGLLELFLSKKDLSIGRKRSYRVLARAISRFQGYVRSTDRKRRNFVFDVDKIDREGIEEFFSYMRNERAISQKHPELFKKLLSECPAAIVTGRKSYKLEERGNNIMVTRKKALKAFFNWMNENGYTKNRPFDGIKIGSEKYGTPYFLSLAERNMVAGHDFSGNRHLETQRDIFIFQCLIGCRVGDLMKLTPANVIDGILEYIPHKTRGENPVVLKVPLNERARAIAKKYEGKDPLGRLFPFISVQKYNDSIKDVLRECGINRPVTTLNPTTGEEEQRAICDIASSHMARRTFIGNLYKKVKDPNLVGSLSGHVEGSKAFARYRVIDMDIKRELVSELE